MHREDSREFASNNAVMRSCCWFATTLVLSSCIENTVTGSQSSNNDIGNNQLQGPQGLEMSFTRSKGRWDQVAFCKKFHAMCTDQCVGEKRLLLNFWESKSRGNC